MSEQKGAREALLKAAEELYATRGFDYVSTREILEAAGQKNQSALQYHFGNKQGLLWAIYDTRMKAVEARRAAMLENAPPMGEEPVRMLIESLIRPLAECMVHDEGGHLFLRLAMQSAFRPDTDMLEVVNSGRYPATQSISRRLDRHFGHLPAKEVPLRKRLVIEACMGCVWIYAQRGYKDGDIETFIRTSVEMGVKCMQLGSQLPEEGSAS